MIIFTEIACTYHLSLRHRRVIDTRLCIELILRTHALRVIVILQNKPVPPGPPAPELLQSKLISLVPPVLYDTPRWSRNFGDVIEQPPKVALPGDTVTAIFVSISLGNNFNPDLYRSEKARH